MQLSQKNYAEWLEQYPIQVMITLSLRDKHINLSKEDTRKSSSIFIRNLSKQRKCQIAGIILYNEFRRKHLHLFLFSIKGDLQSLINSDIAHLWIYGNSCVTVKFSKGIFEYAGRNITPNESDKYDVFYYNKRKLKKSRFYSIQKKLLAAGPENDSDRKSLYDKDRPYWQPAN